MTPRPRIAHVLLAIALMGAAVACGSTEGGPTASGDPVGDGRSLTATVPPAGQATSSTTAPDLGTGTTGATDTLLEACSLLTRADVTAAFGEPAVAGDQRTDECWWSSANDLKTVNLIRRTDDVTTWRAGYQSDYWVPNGFGDEGYTGTALDSVVWRIGDVQYELNVVYSTSGDARQAALDLAEAVTSRL